MKMREWKKLGLPLVLIILLALPLLVSAQLVAPSDSNLRNAQRNAIDTILWAADVLRTEAQNLSRSPDMGLAQLEPEFRAFRSEYEQFKSLLTPEQQAYAAFEIADLDGGMEIIAQTFAQQQQLASVGTLNRPEMLQRTRIIAESVGVWCRKLQTDVRRRLQIR